MTRYGINTAQEMKVSIKDFFSKYDQIRRKLRILSHLLKKSLEENFIFCAVKYLDSGYCWGNDILEFLICARTDTMQD